MSIEGVNRYADVVKAIVKGSFYDAKGTLLPYRDGNTEIRLKTAFSNTQYGLYLNELYTGAVTSDAEGNVVFARHFERGDTEIKLDNLTTGNSLSSWVTVRESALWHVAYAEVFESIDDDWQEAKDDLSIETVTVRGIEDRFGRDLEIYNNLGHDLDTHRCVLH